MKRLIITLVLLASAVASAATIRGVNVAHWDSPGDAHGVPVSGANTVRMVVDFTQPPAANLARAKGWAALGITPMPGNWGGTCKSDVASLTAVVDTWVAQASTWTQLNGVGLINIANEWGPTSTTSTPVPYKANVITPNYTWRDTYIAQIGRMRSAGYTGTLVIDAGSCGQDAQTVYRDGAAVLAGDPLHNLLFDVHVYGGFYMPATAAWQQDYATAMAALKASGLPIIIGEFGPGRSIGPSPTTIDPVQIVADAEANGFGWLAWAWDDNNLNGCQANDAWFSMTVNCGFYTGKDATELTTFGRAVVPLFAKYKAAAVPSVAPVYGSSTALWCEPNYACYMTLTATSPISSKVSFTLTGNDSRVSVTSTGLFAWWTNPAIGTYPMTVVLTDAAGNVTKTPVTLTVSWVKPS